MVILNTNNRSSVRNLTVRYLLEVPRLDLVYCSAREESGRSRLFLVFNEHGKIYSRNGLNGTWVELDSSDECREIRQLLNEAANSKLVPYFTNDRFNVKQVLLN